MDRETERAQRQKIVDEALSWIRTPFHHNQCCKGAGVDCAGFLYGVFRNAGFTGELDIGQYSPDWYLHRAEEKFLEWVRQYATAVETPPYRPGDVVMYRYGRCFAHAAIVIEWPKIIHAYSPYGCVTTDDAENVQNDLRDRKRIIFRLRDWT
jgi:NlpC/P60 family putative phage cell wall peptidase